MTKREKMTIEVPAALRDVLAQWAAEEGRTLATSSSSGEKPASAREI
jgi:hypothetical protein